MSRFQQKTKSHAKRQERKAQSMKRREEEESESDIMHLKLSGNLKQLKLICEVF
jgi:hypothetical protein